MKAWATGPIPLRDLVIMQPGADTLARRVQLIRRETFGEDGIASLAEVMRLPARTWEHYEAGVTIPATIILGFIESTGADPVWLLSGVGERYMARHERRSSSRPDEAA